MLLASIGLAMVLFALNTFFGVPLRLGPSPLWQVAGGICSGILGGLSTVWSPPVVMYLIGRNVYKEEFIGAVGYLFMVGSLGLVLVLGTISLLTLDIAVNQWPDWRYRCSVSASVNTCATSLIQKLSARR